jgi:hypothetical protein
MMEPTTVSEYSAPRRFHLFDALWGSGCVLLHGFGGMFVGDAIDLIFLGTDYIQLPTRLDGVAVTQPRDAPAVECEKEFGTSRRGETPQGRRVFAIESEGRRFHVVAAKLWVMTRTHTGKSSLPVLFGDDLAARETYINEQVKEWYKMTALGD